MGQRSSFGRRVSTMIATAEYPVLTMPRQTQALATDASESVVAWFQEFAGLVGSPCICVERKTHQVVARSHSESMSYAPAEFGRPTSEIRNIEIHPIDGGLLYFLVPVPADGRFVVEGFAKTSRTINPVEFVLASLEAGWEESRIQEWLEMIPVCEERILERLLNCSLELTEQNRGENSSQLEIRSLSQQVDHAREQINLLQGRVHNLENDHDDLLLGFVRSLVSSLDAKDPHTRGHGERVALIARRIGQQLKLSESELDDLALSSLLHDLGKIGVDDRILSKQGRLTRDEFTQIKQHPLIGYQILMPLKDLKSILPGVRNHHEAYNGKGYPDRLRGDEIPLMARIISVADSYDAMATDRPYRKGMPLDQLEEIFHRGSGEQWDPRIVDAYFMARDDIRELFESYSLTGGEGLANLSHRQSGIFSSKNGATKSS